VDYKPARFRRRWSEGRYLCPECVEREYDEMFRSILALRDERKEPGTP